MHFAPVNAGALAPLSLPAPVHCCVLAESRYRAQHQPAGLMRALQRDGCRVTLLDPSQGLLDLSDSRWLDGVDLVIARGHGPGLLAYLGAAEAAGVPTLNRRRAVESVLDQAQMATRLHAARMPTLATWIGGIEQVRHSVPASAFPLLLTPVSGHERRGVLVADTPAELEHITWDDACMIAQALRPGEGCHIKLYGIGERVWAVRKPSPLRGSVAGEVALLPLQPAWEELALRCGELFGLQLYGVDCLEFRGELKVIEVSDFPDYTGVPEADFLLARHAQLHARATAGSPP